MTERRLLNSAFPMYNKLFKPSFLAYGCILQPGLTNENRGTVDQNNLHSIKNHSSNLSFL